MDFLDELGLRLPGDTKRPAGMRAGAENYAASLGLVPGGSGWGAAVRDFSAVSRS